MEGKANVISPLRSGATNIGANLLNGWLRTRDEVKRRLARSMVLSLLLLCGAMIAVPVAVWSFRAEATNRESLEKEYRKVADSLATTEQALAKAQPGVDRAVKFERLKEQTHLFLNSELGLIAATPDKVVLSQVSANVLQGKITMRVLGDAAGKDDKKEYETQAAKGPNVLAAFVTNVSFDRTLFPDGLKFEFVKIAEVAP